MRIGIRVSVLVGVVAVTAAACGSTDKSGFLDPPDNGSSFDGGNANPDTGGGFSRGDASTGPTGGCKPRTCAEAGVSCGFAGDGCGGVVKCGECTLPDRCGGGGVHNVCGGGNKCTPKKKEDVCKDKACGPVADGCGGLIDCGFNCDRSKGESCGGDPARPGQCGGTSACRPTTCAALGIECGKAGDGCGGVLDCDARPSGPPGCPAGTACGGDPARPGKCGGTVSDGGVSNCTPKTCTDLGANCGVQGDGCGHEINCGSCTVPGDSCGGGGKYNVCGQQPNSCVKKTCADIGATCGKAGDGCGGELYCGDCIAPQICGGDPARPSQCGGNPQQCKPLTCTDVGANCGPVGDGCGGLIQCGTCIEPAICGGGGKPSVCGGGDAPDAGQASCPTGSPTTITGKVYAPNGVTPLYNAIVYVPTTKVDPFPANQVSCTTCAADVSGKPIVKTVSGADGSFTLTNVPVGSNIPLVIQIGRWRRQVTIPNVPACKPTSLDAGVTRLPKNKAEGDIPLTALSTGSVDALECLLRKIGIADSEFTGPDSNGRIRMYQGQDDGGGKYGAVPPDGNAVDQSLLLENQGTLNQYDQVLLACEGTQNWKSDEQKQALVKYTESGGRLFATHFSYSWLYNFDPFSKTAKWHPKQGTPTDPLTARIDTGFPKGRAFAEWLKNVDALSATTPPQVAINVPRRDLDAVNDPAQRWIFGDDDNSIIEHFTFNMPWKVAPEKQCGRVIFSDFHVTNAAVNGPKFPKHCSNSALTPQEKILLFMLFDLASCVQPDIPPPPPTCKPQACPSNVKCGQYGDGCGGQIDCGQCTPPQTCGGGGTPYQCGGATCKPTTCDKLGKNCGPVADGCGGILQCGECTVPGETCGGGGTPNVCGKPLCKPRTCADAGATCGPLGDGCGGLLQCGPCTKPGEFCGGGGSPNVCGNSKCIPKTCPAGICGPIADGCGGLAQCEPCAPGETCGGGGTPNKCGKGSCAPLDCKKAGATCGPIGDGCGGTLECGPCRVPGETCGGGGTSSQCGGCKPLTCQQLGQECGPAGDGCGGQIDCGGCAIPGDTCGGGGIAFKCGHPKID